MKKGMKITLGCIFGILVVCFVTVGAVCTYLRTPAGSQFILSKVQAALAKNPNMKLGYKNGQVDPFSKIYFEDLTLIQGSGSDRTELTVKTVDIQYSFSLLSRTVDIEKILISHPKILMKASGPSQKEEVTSNQSQDSLKNLKSWIIAPLVKINIKKFSVDDLSVDLDTKTPESHMVAQIQDAGLQLAFAWIPKKLSVSGEFKLGDSTRVFLSTLKDSQKNELKVNPFAKAKWAMSVRWENSKWIYEIEPTEMQMGLKELSVSQLRPTFTSQLKLSDFKLALKTQLLVKTADLFQLDQKSLENFQLDQSISSGPLVMDQVQGSRPEKTRIASQSGVLNANLGSAVQFKFNHSLKNVFVDSLSLKPSNVEFQSVTDLDRDLTGLKLASTIALDSYPFLHLGMDTKTGSNLQVQGKVGVELSPRLAQTFRSAASLKKYGLLTTDLDFQVQVNEKVSSLLGVNGEKLAEAPVDFGAHLRVQKEEALNIQGKSLAKSGLIDLKSKIELMTGNYLKTFLTPEQLGQVGEWVALLDFGVKVQMPKSKTASVTQEGIIQVSSKTELTQKKIASQGSFPVRFESPIVIEQELGLDHGKTQLDVKTTIPTLEMSKVGKVLDTHFNASVRAPDLHFNKDVDVQLEMKQGEILLAREMMASNNLKNMSLSGLNFILKAGMPVENRFTLKEFSADMNHSMANLTAEATGNPKTGDFQTKGSMKIKFPDNFPEIQGQSIRGQIEFPWVFSVTHGREIHFEGNMDILHLNWFKAPLRVREVSGRIPVSEDFIWDGKKMKFSYLITQNPFERVDYERLQPMIHATEKMSITQIDFEEKTYGPFQGFFSMRQNMIFAHKFDFNLGSGRSSGEMYFDTYPSNLQLGMLSRLTGLNLGEVLPKKYLPEDVSGDKNLSGRMGLVVNLNRGVIDGRVDVTEIGKKQLMTMINVMDPQYMNEQMNRARFALGIAYPTRVEMSFQKGYLDMGVQMGGALSQEFNIRGIPMTSWVSGATSGVVKKTKGIPLK